MPTALDHVRLAMPAGSEEALRAYHGGALGMTETTKPPPLAVHGGRWFRSGDVRPHLGVDPGFRPARKAHPGPRVTGVETPAERLLAHGAQVARHEDLPGYRRSFPKDPVGNRLEFPEPVR